MKGLSPEGGAALAWMCILITAFPIKVAPKKVQKGTRKWPQVIPARSNRGFGICGEKGNRFRNCSTHGMDRNTTDPEILKNEHFPCSSLTQNSCVSIITEMLMWHHTSYDV